MSIAAILALVIGGMAPFLANGTLNWQVMMGIGISVWLIATSFVDIWKKTRGNLLKFGSLSLSFQGMVLAHIGVAISVIGVTMVANYSQEESVRMAPGETYQLADYRFEFLESGHIEGPNYSADATRFRVLEGEREVAILQPEKRRYHARGSVMTEAAIDVGLFRDVYVSMGEPLDNGAWGMRLQVKPFMRWVWLGAIFMSIGGLMAMLDKRYRQVKRKTSSVQKSDEVPA